jgi:cation diffusion facilitator family transporter
MNRAAGTARLSILSNSFLILMKLVVGALSGSVSIISEAIHSLMDLVAAIMAFFSIRIAARPADADHPYGHGKVENVSGVIEAALIVVAAGLIIMESIRKLFTGWTIEHLELCVGVMAASGAVNLLVSRRLYRVAHEEQSVALEADALHLKTDVYTSFGVGGGLLVILLIQRLFHAPWVAVLDPVVAMVIAAFIVREAWKMLRSAFAPLVDSSIPPAELALLQKRVEMYPQVRIHAVRTRRSGKTRYIDFHLVVPETMSVKAAHELCDEIERELAKELPNTSVLIHVEPSFSKAGPHAADFSKDELLSTLERMGREIAGSSLHVHHLHVFDGPHGREITFHIDLEPGETLQHAHAIASKLESRVRAKYRIGATAHVEPHQGA